MIADSNDQFTPLLQRPVAGADPTAPRPEAWSFGRPQRDCAFTRTRRVLWARGLLDAVEPLALEPVPGGWRLFAVHGEVPAPTAAALLVHSNLPLRGFAKDYGTVECVLAPRGTPRSGVTHPDDPQSTMPPGPWVDAASLDGKQFSLVTTPTEGLPAADWMQALPGDPAASYDPDGLGPWNPQRPERLAWATPGAFDALGGVLPVGRRIPPGDYRLVGLWASSDPWVANFNLVERRGGHAILLRVPWCPVVPEHLRGILPALKGNLERLPKWRRLVAENRLEWSRLVVDLGWDPRPSVQGLTGRVQVAVTGPRDVALRTRTVHLRGARGAWWAEVSRWVKQAVRG